MPSPESNGSIGDPEWHLLERLQGDRKDHYSIRLNDQWRICFDWREGGAADVQIVDYH